MKLLFEIAFDVKRIPNLRDKAHYNIIISCFQWDRSPRQLIPRQLIPCMTKMDLSSILVEIEQLSTAQTEVGTFSHKISVVLIHEYV